jgi:hypothetical protein
MAAVSWAMQYERAFTAIGDAQAIGIMKGYLPHREFGVNAVTLAPNSTQVIEARFAPTILGDRAASLCASAVLRGSA